MVRAAGSGAASGAGWSRIAQNTRIADWAAAALPAAQAAIAAQANGWRCGGTWFVGVDALPNGADGAMGGVAFPWQALPLTPVPLHHGQVSVIRPGYPRPDPDESAAAHRFRRDRDAAHLDGLLAVGPQKQRMLREPHGWILGLPLNDCAAAPLVVWEGSHAVLRAALTAALDGYPPHDWAGVDLAPAYTAARTQVFQTCRRIEIPARPGEATLLHRLTLHGVAPWAADSPATGSGRIIAYFRPLLASVADWLRND